MSLKCSHSSLDSYQCLECTRSHLVTETKQITLHNNKLHDNRWFLGKIIMKLFAKELKTQTLLVTKQTLAVHTIQTRVTLICGCDLTIAR